MIKRSLILFFAFAALAGSARAANFAPDTQFEELNDFSGGLYTNVEPHKVPKSFSPSMRNVYTDKKDQSVISGSGFALLGSTIGLDGIKLILPFDRGNGSTEFIVSDSSKVMTTTDFNTYTLLRSGLNSSLNVQAIVANKKVWVTNGSDSVFTYDGTTVTVLDGQTYSGTKTPNVPKGKLPAYDQGRVWMGNTSDNDSYLYFSEPKSTDSVLLSPDDYRAWPGTNFVKVGEGDGTPLTFLAPFKGRMVAGKSYSIYTIFGNSRLSYLPVKTNSKTGFLSQDSVVELDNLLYGQAKDGIYAFDGDNTARLTDRIAPDVANFRTDTSRVVANTWDTEAQFQRGGQFSGTTTTAAGFVTIRTDSVTLNTIREVTPTDSNKAMLSDNISISTYVVCVPTFTVDASYIGIHPRVVVYETSNAGISLKVTMRNVRTGGEWYLYKANTGGKREYDLRCSTIAGSVWTAADINGSSMAIQFQILNFSFPGGQTESCGTSDGGTPGGPPTGGNQYSVYVASQPTYAQLELQSSTTGQYISEITTITSINSYGNFNVTANTNGGSVTTYIHTATSAVNVATRTWMQQSPGSVINSTATNNYAQWAATITAISSANPANIDLVSIEHIEGSGSQTRAFAADWDNRLWMFVSTESTGNFPMLYMKSRMNSKVPDAWMPFDGINIKAIRKWSGILYGGSATGGSFYRLDYGTNYNGSPIVAYYETPELILGNLYFQKTVLELMLDTELDMSNILTLKTSIDGGSFSSQSISLDGTGRVAKRIYNIDKNGKTFRFRFENGQLDQGLQVHDFIVGYMPYKFQ